MEAGHPRCNDGITDRENDVLQRLSKNLKLLWELPVPEKCCCLPLRRGYLVLAYFKLVLNVALFCGILNFLILMYKIFSPDEMFNHGVTWTALCLDIIDIVIGIVIIVYLNQMVKSEVLMLKSINQFQMLNNDEEPLCIFINNADS